MTTNPTFLFTGSYEKILKQKIGGSFNITKLTPGYLLNVKKTLESSHPGLVDLAYNKKKATINIFENTGDGSKKDKDIISDYTKKQQRLDLYNNKIHLVNNATDQSYFGEISGLTDEAKQKKIYYEEYDNVNEPKYFLQLKDDKGDLKQQDVTNKLVLVRVQLALDDAKAAENKNRISAEKHKAFYMTYMMNGHRITVKHVPEYENNIYIMSKILFFFFERIKDLISKSSASTLATEEKSIIASKSKSTDNTVEKATFSGIYYEYLLLITNNNNDTISKNILNILNKVETDISNKPVEYLNNKDASFFEKVNKLIFQQLLNAKYNYITSIKSSKLKNKILNAEKILITQPSTKYFQSKIIKLRNNIYKLDLLYIIRNIIDYLLFVKDMKNWMLNIQKLDVSILSLNIINYTDNKTQIKSNNEREFAMDIKRMSNSTKKPTEITLKSANTTSSTSTTSKPEIINGNLLPMETYIGNKEDATNQKFNFYVAYAHLCEVFCTSSMLDTPSEVDTKNANHTTIGIYNYTKFLYYIEKEKNNILRLTSKTIGYKNNSFTVINKDNALVLQTEKITDAKLDKQNKLQLGFIYYTKKDDTKKYFQIILADEKLINDIVAEEEKLSVNPSLHTYITSTIKSNDIAGKIKQIHTNLIKYTYLNNINIRQILINTKTFELTNKGYIDNMNDVKYIISDYKIDLYKLYIIIQTLSTLLIRNKNIITFTPNDALYINDNNEAQKKLKMFVLNILISYYKITKLEKKDDKPSSGFVGVELNDGEVVLAESIAGGGAETNLVGGAGTILSKVVLEQFTTKEISKLVYDYSIYVNNDFKNTAVRPSNTAEYSFEFKKQSGFGTKIQQQLVSTVICAIFERFEELQKNIFYKVYGREQNNKLKTYIPADISSGNYWLDTVSIINNNEIKTDTYSIELIKNLGAPNDASPYAGNPEIGFNPYALDNNTSRGDTSGLYRQFPLLSNQNNNSNAGYTDVGYEEFESNNNNEEDNNEKDTNPEYLQVGPNKGGGMKTRKNPLKLRTKKSAGKVKLYRSAKKSLKNKKNKKHTLKHKRRYRH